MPKEPDDKDSPGYRVYRSGSASGPSGQRRRPAVAPSAVRDRASGERPYRTYRAGSRGLIARLRGETDADLLAREEQGPARGGLRRQRFWQRRGGRRRWTPWRVGRWILGLIVGWVLLSAVLFFISATERAGNLPAGAGPALTSGGPMLTSADTVLVLGLDNRPRTGPGSKEGGANFNEAHALTDTIMLWRVGGGVSRRLSIPRDTLVAVPGHGMEKINAAWSQGGPGLTIRTVKELTGLSINHLIVIDLGNFPKFIDDIGGVTVKTGRICSNISGGVKNGGFTLNLRPGTHHLDGLNAMILARTRENSCNPAYNDLNREAAQQQILNGIKAQLFSLHAFLHLPWASWDAPGVIQTDMGGLSLMQLFFAAEIGGSAPVSLLKETGQVYNGADVLVPSQANVRSAVNKLIGG